MSNTNLNPHQRLKEKIIRERLKVNKSKETSNALDFWDMATMTMNVQQESNDDEKKWKNKV